MITLTFCSSIFLVIMFVEKINHVWKIWWFKFLVFIINFHQHGLTVQLMSRRVKLFIEKLLIFIICNKPSYIQESIALISTVWKLWIFLVTSTIKFFHILKRVWEALVKCPTHGLSSFLALRFALHPHIAHPTTGRTPSLKSMRLCWELWLKISAHLRLTPPHDCLLALALAAEDLTVQKHKVQR